MLKLYCLVDLGLYRSYNLVYSSPLVFVLGSASNNAEAFKNVDDIVNSSPFNSKFFGTAIQEKHSFAINTVGVQKAATKLA